MEVVENEKIDNVEQLQPFTQEELMNAEKYDPNIDYRKELLKKYENYELPDYTGLDDFVEEQDKVALIRYCNLIIKKNFPEYPSVMEELLVKKMYYDTITNMSKEDYLEEKRQQNNLSTIDKELQKIKDEDNLEYALKDFEKK
jgi:hypothetical protein|tara:strand:- start:561 stop:989 length:429 start_codon:yes stop_codon:yes gene_type:complete